MNKYFKICMKVSTLSIDPNTFEFKKNVEIKDAYISVPEDMDPKTLRDQLKIACSGCDTYAYVETTEEKFNYNKTKYNNAIEVNDKFEPIGDNNE